MTEMVKTVLNGEFEIIIPKHRADRPDWYQPSGWEKPRLKDMHERIGPGDVVYYVGAEEGEFPALCQMWGAEVYLFEPNPKVWPNIKAIWEANGLSDPVSFSGFASNETALLGQEVRTGFPPCADEEIIGAHGFKELYQEAENYPQVRLDDVCGQMGHQPPTVISFDVEGSEWQVLRGAEQTLREHHPTLFASIHPEFLFHQWGEYSRDLRNWIIGLGYRETYIDYAHELHTRYDLL